MKKGLTTKRIYRVAIILIIISLIYAMIISIINKEWLILFVSCLTVIIAISPFFFKRRFNLRVPTEIELIIILFIYASLFLGEVYNFYQIFWWWDILLHAISAIIFGFIGFTILYFMIKRHELNAKPWAITIFSFSFALAIGAIWEIIEFSIDQFFGLNMQKSGLLDTMGDLIVDALGAIFASTIAFIYLKTKKTLIFHQVVEKISDKPKT